MKLPRVIAAAAAAALLCQSAVVGMSPALAQQPAATYQPQSGQEGKDVVWIPTHQALVDRMLDMAQLRPDDYLVDLGSGDGRTVITAARRGVRSLGIEYNPDLVKLSTAAAEAEGVADRARFVQADIFESDFSDATVVTLFLLPTLNMKLRPTILAMKPGTRVVSNTFDMGDWRADQTIESVETDCSNFCRAYRWVVPAKAAGTWRLDDGELRLKQRFQMLEGTLLQGGQEVAISEGRMNGAEIAFTAGDRQFTGSVDGGRMAGTSRTPQGSQTWSAARSAP